MSGAASSVSAGANSRDAYTAQGITSKPAPEAITPDAISREQQLAQQLDSNLTARISRIREQIGSSTSTSGVGKILDIQA